MIFDAHTHWDPGDERNEEGIAYARSRGVERALAFGPGFSPRRPDWRKVNEGLVGLAERFPEFIHPVATLDPMLGPGAAEDLRWAIRERHMVGLKLIPVSQGFRALSDEAFAVFEEAEKLGAPVFLYCSHTPFSTPSIAGLIAERLPGLKLVLSHAGSNNYWADAIRAARRHGNITLLSCGNPPRGIARMVREIGARRVLFGSDFPCGYPHSLDYELAKFELLEISAGERERILGGNTAELVGIGPQGRSER